jgi:hypothetical protein
MLEMRRKEDREGLGALASRLTVRDQQSKRLARDLPGEFGKSFGTIVAAPHSGTDS